MAPPGPATAEVIEAFLTSARARSCSRKYIEKLAYTLSFRARAHQTIPTTTAQLEAFLAGVAEHRKADGAPLRDATRVEIWASTKRLYAWISERGSWTRNPMAPIRRPRRRAFLPRVLTQYDVDRVLDVNARWPREFAMLCVMLDTMARLGELAALTWDHVKQDEDGPSIQFPDSGKQGARSAPLNRSTLAALTRASYSGPLWTRSDGEALTYDGVKMAFRRALGRAGIKGNPHIMRHTAATLHVKNGGSLFSLMRIGGWTSLKAVTMYVSLANSDVRDQHARYSVIARRAAERGSQLRLLDASGG